MSVIENLDNGVSEVDEIHVDEDKNTEKLIIVTGFGPFYGHEAVNASWEAVRRLPTKLIHGDITYKIDQVEVPVQYDVVDQKVEEIWSRKPELVIHCGVHGGAKCIHVEKLAYNEKFSKTDYSGKKLPCPKISLENGNECPTLYTKFDVAKICQAVNDACGCKETLAPSNDVGNYLCGYIYLRSLDKNCQRCLFVHVPPIDKPFSSQETSDALLQIIGECVRQIQDQTAQSCANTL